MPSDAQVLSFRAQEPGTALPEQGRDLNEWKCISSTNYKVKRMQNEKWFTDHQFWSWFRICHVKSWTNSTPSCGENKAPPSPWHVNPVSIENWCAKKIWILSESCSTRAQRVVYSFSLGPSIYLRHVYIATLLKNNLDMLGATIFPYHHLCTWTLTWVVCWHAGQNEQSCAATPCLSNPLFKTEPSALLVTSASIDKKCGKS